MAEISGKTKILLICVIVSFILLDTALSKYILSGFGNTLIYDIEIENNDGNSYNARLYRPIKASSMNQRPAVLLAFENRLGKNSGDYVGSELARRGFVVLSVADSSNQSSDVENGKQEENMIDAGYTYLSTRSFTDHDRIGAAAWNNSVTKVLNSKNYSKFTSKIYLANKGNSDIEKSITPESNVYYASGLDSLIFGKKTVSSINDIFHNDLDLPDDNEFSEITGTYSVLLYTLRIFRVILVISIFGVFLLPNRNQKSKMSSPE